MGQMCCRPNRPSTTPTSSMTTTTTTTDLLTSSYNTPIPTSYVQRPSTPVTSSNIAKCPECHQLTSTLYWNWCQHCSARHFSINFANWSSGNPNLDKLIQEIQLNATYSEQVIEWIPYERFQNVKFISRGGFGEVMYAEWEDGQIYNWDTSMATWKRRGRHPVALKKLKESEECPEDFLNEVKSLHSITRQNLSFEVTHCFGISQDPITKEYIMVISYAENGSLHHYLQRHPNIDWPTRICYLLKITQGLSIIHSAGLIHRDFHSGNILMGKRYPMVSDFGLSRYVGGSSDNGGIAGDAVSPDNSSGSYNDDNSSIFGVIPYIAPEVLKGHPYTLASDIYSFGMIMYELLTDHQPFDDTAHDLELITRITSISVDNTSSLATPASALNSTTTLVSPSTSPSYKIMMPSSSPYAIASQAVTGSNPNNSTVSLLNLDRPSLHNIQHPKCWIRLMYKCWNDDPAQRPTIVELKEVLDKWYQLMETNVARNKEDLEILRDFRDAENFRMDGHKRSSMSGLSMKSGRLVNNNSMSIMETRERHPEACYYSRKIPTTRLVRKLEEQMGVAEVRDYINLKFLQKDPLINNISRSDLRSSLSTMSTINNLISSQYHRQSDTLNNVKEIRDTDDDDDDDMANRDSIPNNSNLGKSVVGGVLEMLRDSYTVEEMNQIDGGDVGIDADTQKDDFLNLLNADLESSYLPNIGGTATPLQNSYLGIPNNNNNNNNNGPLLIIEDENQISSTIDTTQKLGFNDSNIVVVSNATSNTSRTQAAMSYFREYPRKNLTQSHK